jgi:hypothetical protein
MLSIREIRIDWGEPTGQFAWFYSTHDAPHDVGEDGSLTSPIPQHGVRQSIVTILWQVNGHYLFVVSLFFVCCLVGCLFWYLFGILIVMNDCRQTSVATE